MRINPRPPDLHLVLLPIEVAPLQTQNLADPQSQTDCHNAHRAVGLRDLQKNFLKLLNGQYSRHTHPLRGIFHTHKGHGVGQIRKQLPSHSAVEENPHLVLQVALTLWREVESLQPLFDSNWLDLVDGVLAPLGPDVVLQPALIASRSRVPVRELFHEITIYHGAKGHHTSVWVLCVDTEQQCLSSPSCVRLSWVLLDSPHDRALMDRGPAWKLLAITHSPNICPLPSVFPFNTSDLIPCPLEHSLCLLVRAARMAR